MKKLVFLYPLLVLALLAVALPSTITPSPVMADSGKSMPIGTRIVLDNNVEAVYKGKTLDGDYKWEATIGGPKYLDDLVTPITCRWQYDAVKAEWFTMPNLFTAIAKGAKVTVDYNGQKLSWEPDVFIGTKKLKASFETLLINDPINENYFGNTLQWDYEGIIRNVRIIEGMLIEYYTINQLPGGDVIINSHTAKDAGFVWTRPAMAWDSEGKAVDLILDGHDVTLTLDTMKLATLPITIDPDTTFTTSSSDGYIYRYSTSYNTAWNTATGLFVEDSDTYMNLGQFWSSPNYFVERAFVFFDTSVLPDDCSISSAILQLYGFADLSTTEFNMTVQSGMPTYPSDPLVTSNYNKTLYSGDGGALTTVGFTKTAYNNVTLNATGEGWINKEGVTKFAIRSDREIAGTTPTGNELVRVYSYEKGIGYWPELVVTYGASATPTVTTVNATYVTYSTARLNSYLDDDGDEACDVRFQYNTTTLPFNATNSTVWAYNTTWVNDTYYSTNTPYNDTSGLVNATSYAFRVQARNTLGTINGTPLYFTTESGVSAPTFLQAYPSSTSVDLAWTKGSGSVNTKVRAQIGAYPANYTDGDSVYFGIGGTASYTGLLEGNSYYFRAWGESGGNYSTSYASVMATTSAGGVAGDTPATPTTPSGWWGTPDYTVLGELPIYSIVNDVADDYGIPRGTFWLGLILLGIMSVGLVIYSVSHNSIMAVIAAGVLIYMASRAELMSMWILAAYAVPAISVMIVQRRT